MKNPLVYRFSQLVGLLLGARIFVLLFFTFTLYVSTFFLFNQEESLRNFVFDYKVHGIIFCAVLSIAAGGIINHFYDREKDAVAQPFRSRLQGFLKEKYFLYSYLLLNAVSLLVSGFLSWRILVFFLVYQFLIWLYSHKLSKMVAVNNLVFVGLSLYPFFGMLVYYRHFSVQLLLMALFLFFVLLAIDLIKDILTLHVDRVFGYRTLANVFGKRFSYRLTAVVLLLNGLVSAGIVVYLADFSYLAAYFLLSAAFFMLMELPVLSFRKTRLFWVMALLRLWVFVGVLFMLLNGIFEKF